LSSVDFYASSDACHKDDSSYDELRKNAHGKLK
jgi:hypothetical protein